MTESFFTTLKTAAESVGISVTDINAKNFTNFTKRWLNTTKTSI